MGFDLVDKVKSIVKDVVLFILKASPVPILAGCWLLLGVVFWQLLHILLCSIRLFRLHTLRIHWGWKFLIRSLMNTKKRVGYRTPPCGTPCLRSIFLLFVLFTTTLARRLCMSDLIHQNIFPWMLHFFSFKSRPSVQTLSNVFCRSIHTVSVLFLRWNPSSISCARYVV